MPQKVAAACFFNDYYFGNILYFIGAYLILVPLLLFEIGKPYKTFNKKEMIIMSANALFFSAAILAYSGFDRVFVGLVYSTITTLIIAYSIGTIVSLLIRFIK